MDQSLPVTLLHDGVLGHFAPDDPAVYTIGVLTHFAPDDPPVFDYQLEIPIVIRIPVFYKHIHMYPPSLYHIANRAFKKRYTSW